MAKYWLVFLAIIFQVACGPVGGFNEPKGWIQVDTPATSQKPLTEVQTGHQTDGHRTDQTDLFIQDQVIGGYQSAGARLEKASNLFLREISYRPAAPFRILEPGRKTFYGSIEMVDMIVFIGEALRSLVPGQRLLVGDISKEHGGPLEGHLSHRNGLDADLSYVTRPELKRADFQSVVRGNVADTLMIKEQFQLFQLIVISGTVDRILVHPKVKNALCVYALNSGDIQKPNGIETLRRLSRESNHDDHFHLRLKCSKAQPRCVSEPDPAKGSGC